MAAQGFRYPPPKNSSRSAYPQFLSFPETVQLQLSWARQGIVDACRWDTTMTTILGDAEIRANAYKSLLLNIVSLTSIYIFDLLLLPLVQEQDNWIHHVGWFYQILWLLPVVGVSYYLNSSWCSVIAKRAYTLQHGNNSMASQQASSYTGVLTHLATTAYRGIMVFTSVVVSFALGYVPYVGPVASFVFMCWIDSYYCFEFVWIARGMSLSRRIRHMEERWAYYFAFGIPSTLLCNWSSSLANVAIFALIYPMFIIMAMHSRPVPNDPYNPVPPIASSRPEDNDIIRHPSPFIPIRLPIFALVMFLNDWIVQVLSLGNRAPGHRPKASRALSDFEVEEGKNSLSGGRSSVPFDANTSSRGARINIGRRKLD